MNSVAETVDRQLEPKDAAAQQEQITQCEKFTRDVLKKVLQKFITEKLAPLINSVVETYVDQIKLTKDITEQ